MLHSNAKFSDVFISILVGRGDVLDLIWVVSSDGENIGRVTYPVNTAQVKLAMCRTNTKFPTLSPHTCPMGFCAGCY